ncbi:MAG: DUF3786 domain-containing protein [Deltaproteobacteria bacterium]|nr:DUF3786 domain-containing protein [Candidatus Tharpella sp.]
MNLKVATGDVLPVDPEENCQYSRFDQLNPAWWRKVERLVAENEGEVFPHVQVFGGGLELPWFNRRLRLEPETFSISFDKGNEPQPTYQDGLVVLALLNYLSENCHLPKPVGLINENHLTGGTTFFRGPHVMASALLARRFAKEGVQLLEAGKNWGGKQVDFGEYALSFTIFPGLDWSIALWEEDEEFCARAQYFFDKNLEQIFQLDVIWALGNVVAAKLLDF